MSTRPDGVPGGVARRHAVSCHVDDHSDFRMFGALGGGHVACS